jgi:hypothetical protein
MARSVRSGLIAVALLCGAAFAFSAPAQARSNFFFSANIGLPLYTDGYFAPGWYHRPAYYPRPYYVPRYYAPRPIYYPRPYDRPDYYRPYYGPVVSLGLFPGHVGTVLTPDDRDIYFRAYRGALAAPIGQSMVWNSNRVSGAVTTTRDGWAGQRYCREFRQEITIDGRNEQAYGTACQMPDGDWQLVTNP